MKLVIVGCGRVGSAIATRMAGDGHDVSVVDEDAEALQRLPEDWPGQFVHGHGLDLDVLVEAGIDQADAVVVATDGDNTNIVIAQVAQKRFERPLRGHPDPGSGPGGVLLVAGAADRVRHLVGDRDDHAGDLRDAGPGRGRDRGAACTS